MNAGTSSPVLDEALLGELRTICGPARVLTAPSTLATYRRDAGNARERTPAAAVLPDRPEQVVAILTALWRRQIPWVLRGAGTGYRGGALAGPDELLVVLSRMRAIHAVDAAALEVHLEPGVTPRALAARIAPGLLYPVQPASAGVATLGGTVATNAGGPASARYGTTAEQVRGLDVVLPDGERMWLRRGRPGPDLLDAFIGSEGRLGVIVGMTLALRTAPETVQTALALFPTLGDAGAAAQAIIASGAQPSALELLDALALRAGAAADGAPVRREAGAALLIEVDGNAEDAAEAFEAVLALCARHGARDVTVATRAGERRRLWALPERAFAAMRRVAGAYRVEDLLVPPHRLVEVLARISALSSEYGLAVAHVAHLADANLHPIICHAPHAPASAARAAALAERIAAVCIEVGGSDRGEHGRGRDTPDPAEELLRAGFVPAPPRPLPARR